MKKNLLLLIFIASTFISEAQNVGIGTANPLTNLHISFGASGNINPYSPLVVEGNNNTYINILTPNINESGLLFGKADNAASGGIIYNNPGNLNGFQFRTNGNLTRMVIANNGYVGIGNNNPAYQLDVANRMRIRSGGNNTVSAGLWLNSYANSEAAFIGMEGDTHVGFFGIGSGWKFSMNTQTGALKINGSEGLAGQALKSGGSGVVPSWGSISNWLFNNTYEINQTANMLIPNGFATPTLPGMDNANLSITITTNSKLIVSAFLKIQSISCFGCGTSHVGVGTQINGPGFFKSILAEGNTVNGQILTLNTGVSMVDVGPGVYTFRTFAFIEFGSTSHDCSGGRLFVAVIPQ